MPSEPEDPSRPALSSRLRIVGSVALALLLGLSLSQALDQQASGPVDDAFERALITFAVVRGINAVVSVVQGTEVALEPAGVGVILTPGEIFDPVNDLIERFSWIMLASSTSLGAQKVLIDLGTGWVLQGATGVALALFAYLLWRPRTLAGRARALALNLCTLVLFVRFAVPVVVVINNLVYDAFLDERYEASYLALEKARDEVEALNDADRTRVPTPGKENLIDRLGRWYNSTAERLDVDGRIAMYSDRLARASEHIIQLIVVFSLQTVVFPLLLMWLGLRLLRALLAVARS